MCIRDRAHFYFEQAAAHFFRAAFFLGFQGLGHQFVAKVRLGLHHAFNGGHFLGKRQLILCCKHTRQLRLGALPGVALQDSREKGRQLMGVMPFQ